MILLFIPIGITVDLAEKIDNMLESEVAFKYVLVYYGDFTIYFANLLFPLFLFLSVIWFTSKLANQTEIIAFLSSGVSFWRFMRPYVIGATIVCVGALLMGMYLAPAASKGYNEFRYQYLKKNKSVQETRNVYKQINDSEYIYASDFIPKTQLGINFSLEHFEGNELKFKISANRIKYKPEDTIYTLTNYVQRYIGERGDSIISKPSYDTILPFEIDELTPVTYVAETLPPSELSAFIEKESQRGSSDLSRYKVVAYRRWSLPVSAYILTLIGVAVSAIKRRGGIGANLAFGIGLAFTYIFVDKIFSTMAIQSNFSPVLAVWLPNIAFGILAVYLLYNAKR